MRCLVARAGDCLLHLTIGQLSTDVRGMFRRGLGPNLGQNVLNDRRTRWLTCRVPDWSVICPGRRPARAVTRGRRQVDQRARDGCGRGSGPASARSGVAEERGHGRLLSPQHLVHQASPVRLNAVCGNQNSYRRWPFNAPNGYYKSPCAALGAGGAGRPRPEKKWRKKKK